MNSFLPNGWNVVMMIRAAAAILDHEVESVGIKKWGAWISHASLPALHHLSLKSFMSEWSLDFLFKPLLFRSYSWFLNSQVVAWCLDSGRSSTGPLWTWASSCANKTVNVKYVHGCWTWQLLLFLPCPLCLCCWSKVTNILMRQGLELHKTDTQSLLQKVEKCNLQNSQKVLMQEAPVQCSKTVKKVFGRT